MRNFIIFLLLLTACETESYQDFQEEGRSIARKLIKEMQGIHTKEELIRAEPRLKKQYTALAKVMIAASRFKKEQIKNETVVIGDKEVSEELYAEMNRLLKIEGGRKHLEKSQEEALFLLYARTSSK